MTDASSPISQPSVRQQVFFSGRVQGVGFRYTTRHIAQNFAVTGFVRNLVDGRVELVAEGSPQELRSFLAEIQERMGANIVRMESHNQPAQAEFRSFDIL